MTKQQKQNRMTLILLIIYLALITWIILFKMQFSITGHYRNINLIPFNESLIVNGRVDFSEIIQNIIVFIPVGIYVCMLKEDWTFIKKVLPAACISLVFEILQYILAVGATDITDLIDNTLGGIIGIGIYAILYKISGSRGQVNKVLNILALIATVCLLCFLGLLIIANL